MARGATLERERINRSDRFSWRVDNMDSLDNTSDPSSLKPTQTPDTLNTVYDLSGATETRKGVAKLITTSLSGAIINEHPFYLSDGVTKQLIFAVNANNAATAPGGVAGTYLYKYNNAGGGTLIGGPYTLNSQWDFTTYQNKVFAVNGFDGVLQYTGSGNFTQVSTITLQYIETHKNRLWGILRNSSTLQFCDANNPSSWPANSYTEFTTGDGQVGTGIKKYLDSIMVFKTDSVWYFTGEPMGAGSNTTLGNLQIHQADSEVGCVSFKTIKKIRRGILMWASTSGIAIMQNYHADIISEDVDKTFRSGMNTNFLSSMYAFYSPQEKKYVLGYPSSTSTICDSAILLDLGDPHDMKISLWDHYYGSCATLYRFTQTDSVLIGHPTKGFIVQAFQGYADIFGDNGQSTGSNTSTTLNDTTKSWTVNQAVDADVTIISGTGQGQQRTISANSSNQLTLSSAWTTTPDATSVYSIGAYVWYRDTPIEGFGKDGYDKKFKYMKIFADSQSNYPMLFGHALDYQPLSFNDPSISLDGGNLKWTGVGGANKWGQAGAKWGKKKELFLRQEIGETGKHLQCRVGGNKANQPGRITKYSISLKFKKERPDNA